MKASPPYEIVASKELTYEQKVLKLAQSAENTIDVLSIPKKTSEYMEKGIICDLGEGSAPYRPRYTMPDYEKAIKNGSEFLRLDPPKNFDDALTFLMILYRHVPSITSFPVYLGELDALLEPFAEGHSDEELSAKLKNFLIYLDRTITDGFCHANLGPKDSRVGRIILELERELQNAVPNLTLKYDPKITPDDYASKALYTSLFCANPAFCNDIMHRNTYERYGISSCYNILPIGGGSYTLTRLVLPRLALIASDRNEFMNKLLPECLKCMADYMNERIRFIVEKSNFFESSFLVKEGLLERKNFLAMFGIVGLAECSNILIGDKNKTYGHDADADALADEIMTAIEEFTQNCEAAYSEVAGGHFLLHAQVGIDTDIGVTSGVRIPIGQEPDSLYDHLRHSARFHRFFPTGCADIFPIEVTGRNNPEALLDIVKGAFSLGDKYISFYASDSDLVRITGYLVKRSEMDKYNNKEAVLQNTTHLGAANYQNAHLENRKVRGLDAGTCQ